jgi:hypothetical protein
MTTMLLEGLAQINWASLRHAYGAASNIPELFQAMLAGGKRKRDNALYKLSDLIQHQGTVYSATSAAIPFLYRFLASDLELDRPHLINIFRNLSLGTGYLQVHTKYPDSAATWHKILGEEGKTLEEEIAREEEEVAKVHHAIGEGLHHLIPYLRHEKSWVRECAAECLQRYPTRADLSLPALLSALEEETDEQQRGALSKARDTLVSSLSATPRGQM